MKNANKKSTEKFSPEQKASNHVKVKRGDFFLSLGWAFFFYPKNNLRLKTLWPCSTCLKTLINVRCHVLNSCAQIAAKLSRGFWRRIYQKRKISRPARCCLHSTTMNSSIIISSFSPAGHTRSLHLQLPNRQLNHLSGRVISQAMWNWSTRCHMTLVVGGSWLISRGAA